MWFRILFFFHGHQKHIHLVLGGFQKLVAQVDVGDVERNVLAGLGLDSVEQLIFGHQGHADALDDYRVARNRSRHIFRLDLLPVENGYDLFGDRGRIHDGAVHDRILCQRLKSEAHQFITSLRLFQLNRFDRA